MFKKLSFSLTLVVVFLDGKQLMIILVGKLYRTPLLMPYGVYSLELNYL